jgi:hypothetical protein
MRTSVLRVKCDDKTTAGAPCGNQTARHEIFQQLVMERVYFFFFYLSLCHDCRSDVVSSPSLLTLLCRARSTHISRPVSHAYQFRHDPKRIFELVYLYSQFRLDLLLLLFSRPLAWQILTLRAGWANLTRQDAEKQQYRTPDAIARDAWYGIIRGIVVHLSRFFNKTPVSQLECVCCHCCLAAVPALLQRRR